MGVGGSLSTIFVKVTCNKSLADKFELYERDKSYSGAWSAFDLRLRTYWKTLKKG